MKPLFHAKNPGMVGMTARGIQSVRMEAAPTPSEIKAALDAIQTAFAAFRDSNDQRVSALERGRGDVLSEDKVNRINETLDELSTKIAAMQLNGTSNADDPRAMTPGRKAHAKAFNSFFRKGAEPANMRELEVNAALTTTSDPDGGYLVPFEMETTVDRVLTKVSAMRQLATVRNIGTAAYKKPFNVGGTSAGWVGEKQDRPKTNGPQLSLMDFPAMELYAEPAATQSMLDDAFFDVGAWLADEVSLIFAEQEGSAFVNGDGVIQPKGLLKYGTVADNAFTWGKLGFVAVGTGGAFKADGTAYDDLIDVTTAPKQGYRVNASWLMNRKTEGAIRKIKDPVGNYIWAPATMAGALATLANYPVSIDDNMDDIAANKYPMAFGDFRRGYLIVDRIGVRVLRDPLTQKPFVLFYTTKRVGGGVQNFEAIKLAKITA